MRNSSNYIIIFIFVICKSISCDYFICEASDNNFVGRYIENTSIKRDGVSTFSNSNERSFFRHGTHWYLGDISVWPPETYYRCVQPNGCNKGESNPPTSEQGEWTVAQKFKDHIIPLITTEECLIGMQVEL